MLESVNGRGYCLTGEINLNQFLILIKINPGNNLHTATASQVTNWNQLLQLYTAHKASVIRSETSLITESDRSGPIR